MKNSSYKLLGFALVLLFSAAIANKALAQQKLIYYWHFNNLNTGLTKGVSPSTISTIHANSGSLDSTKAFISYLASSTVSSKYLTYWDAVAGEASDTFNVKTGPKGATTGNNALRVRNPSDSMELRFTLPATKYKNMTLKFATERSSTTSGPGKQIFDYSTDGGSTWKTSGMSIPTDSFNNAIWDFVSVSFAADIAVNNNANFIFRIKLAKPNTGTSGNARFDNISLEGDSIATPVQKLIHYWHFNNINTGTTKAGSLSLIKPMHANWSSLDSNKALITYVPVYTVSAKYLTYWDNNAGDTINARRDKKNQVSGTNNALRVRNPSDSMALICYLPTTKYKNINIKYELELSSSGPTGSAGGRELFDYSIDSGKTFTQTGLSITYDSITNSNWNLISINLGADAKVNNNPKFAFRIRTTAPNSGTSGNHRYDNFTVEGDSFISPVAFGLPLYEIRQLRGQNITTGVADSLNKGKGFIKGVVHSPSFSTSLQFSLLDSTGAMTVFTSKIKYYTPAFGDSIIVKGTLTQFNGVTEYTADTIAKLTKGTWLKPATVVAKLDETRESDLIKINNVHLLDTTKWLPAGSGFNVDITNGKDTFSMRIVSVIDLFKKGPIKGNFNVTGIETQFKSGTPFIGGYQIEPRGIADIELIASKPITPLYKIRQVRGQNLTTGAADSAGSKNKFFVKGIAQSPSFSPTGTNFSLMDSTGNIIIFNSAKLNGYTPAIGDSVQVRGLLTQFNGLTEVTADSISKLTGASTVSVTKVITKMDESMESGLVKFNNGYLVNPTQWTGTGSGFNVDVTNGKDTIQVRITNGVDLYSKPAPKGRFNVEGIVGQFKSASPFIGGYQLQPRGIIDLQIIPLKLYTISQVKGYNTTTGIADSLNVNCFLKGVVHSPNLGGPLQFFSLKDNTGAISIAATTPVNGYKPNVGDSIKVRGVVLQTNGVTIFLIDSVKNMTGGAASSPVLVTRLDETTESDLVTLQSYRLADLSKWDTTLTTGRMDVKAYKGTDTITLAIIKGTSLYSNSAKPTSYFDVTGIGSQDDASMPFLQNYILIPRSISDIVHSSGIPLQNGNNEMVTIYPNPASNHINIIAGARISEIRIMNSVGQLVAVQLPEGNETSMDISQLKPGIYFVRVASGNSITLEKIVKE